MKKRALTFILIGSLALGVFSIGSLYKNKNYMVKNMELQSENKKLKKELSKFVEDTEDFENNKDLVKELEKANKK